MNATEEQSLRLIADNIKLRQDLDVARRDLADKNREIEVLRSDRANALERVVKAETAIQAHADTKKSPDYSYWPDPIDYKLWVVLTDG